MGGGNTPWFQNNWVVGGITFIVGVIIGWLITQWWPVTNNGNGMWSTYTKDSVGKITLTVAPNTNGVITSELFGPHSKKVWVQQAGLPAHIAYYGAAFPETDHVCGEARVGWVLQPGTYEVYVASDASTPCAPMVRTPPYPDMPDVYSNIFTIVLPGSHNGPSQIKSDSYRFHTGGAGDETHITLVIESN